MSHRRLLFSVLLIGLLFASGNAMACEGCFGPGQQLPGGAKTDAVTCWTYDDGPAGGCYVEPGYGNCKLWDYSDNCPVPAQPPNGGGSGGGNNGGSGTGGTCRRDSTGTCPPECTSCGGSFNNI